MKLFTQTNSGIPVRLTIEMDKFSVPQIYAYFKPSGCPQEERCLCDGWGGRRTSHGFQEGILTCGLILQIPKGDWNKIVQAREDLRDRQNLENVHLVKVYSRGNRVTIQAYTLSARVDRGTWESIAPFMREVDSTVNDELLEGDHFVGWVIEEGKEEEVEHILGVKPQGRLQVRSTESGG